MGVGVASYRGWCGIVLGLVCIVLRLVWHRIGVGVASYIGCMCLKSNVCVINAIGVASYWGVVASCGGIEMGSRFGVASY